MHMQKSSSRSVGFKDRRGETKDTDRRTDIADRITFPTNTISKKDGTDRETDGRRPDRYITLHCAPL